MSAPPTARQAAPRFHSKITDVTENGCWIWGGKVARDGYGRFSYQSRWVMAHRWAYETYVAPIPDGKEIDHLCKVTTCVNPAHLEAVTRRENMLRQDRIGGRARQTHCLRGHEYTAENTKRDSRGNRCCRTCVNAAQRAAKAAARGAVA